MDVKNRSPHSAKKEIFWKALECSTPNDQVKYLDRACGYDKQLRYEVEALIKCHKSDNFLEQFIPKVNLFESLGPRVGDTINRYTLLKEIGEGGCGIVFLAEQEKPLRRQVALKVIRPGMYNPQVLHRFGEERQALAELEHSNIARIYDAGTTNTGQPYFVMELIRGEKITEYADTHQLSIQKRLNLFLKVCWAIQHAHENGIIHRDIKPSNILVGEENGEPLPKVIDFGIAKANGEGKALNTDLLTSTGLFVGTPAYMSPEQANGQMIDRRTDIYSLGVLLYVLLTKHLPLDLEGLAIFEQLRAIIEEEPRFPSVRIKELKRRELEDIAKNRSIEPDELIRVTRGDLDRIVMKCLKKNREHRYETTSCLAADLQKYLENNSQIAGAQPPSEVTLPVENFSEKTNTDASQTKHPLANSRITFAIDIVCALSILGVFGSGLLWFWCAFISNTPEVHGKRGFWFLTAVMCGVMHHYLKKGKHNWVNRQGIVDGFVAILIIASILLFGFCLLALFGPFLWKLKE